MEFYQMITVRPGDCLWLIAQRHLGAGDQYPQIEAVNLGRLMGGGQVFTDPSVLRPGWVLQVPARYERAGADDDASVQQGLPGWHGGHDTGDHLFRSGHQAAAHGPRLSEHATVSLGMLAGGAAPGLAPGRHRQPRVRSRNRRILVPAPPAAGTEHLLRAASDVPVPSWRAGLADLGEQLLAGGELPVFTAVRLLPDGLELLLASPAEQPPPAEVIVGG